VYIPIQHSYVYILNAVYIVYVQCICIYALPTYTYIYIVHSLNKWSAKEPTKPLLLFLYDLLVVGRRVRSGVCAWHFINSGARQSVRVTGKRVYMYARIRIRDRGRENARVCLCMASGEVNKGAVGGIQKKIYIYIYTLWHTRDRTKSVEWLFTIF